MGGVDAAAGFGQATFEMQELLRGAGLEVSSGNNQYAGSCRRSLPNATPRTRPGCAS